MCENISVEESVLKAMDGDNIELLKHVPYLMQDLFEMGTPSDIVSALLKKNNITFDNASVLDLGCGKGAVGINLAKTFGWKIHGIDGVKEFIETAMEKTAKFGVSHLCRFETGDIREKVKSLNGFDVCVLGAIGPVFGDYYQTLSVLDGVLNSKGWIIIADGYLEEDSDFIIDSIKPKSVILEQIKKAGMELVDEIIPDPEKIKSTNQYIFDCIKNRAQELITKHPEDKQLLENYIKKQESENDIIENKIVVSLMLIRKG